MFSRTITIISADTMVPKQRSNLEVLKGAYEAFDMGDNSPDKQGNPPEERAFIDFSGMEVYPNDCN